MSRTGETLVRALTEGTPERWKGSAVAIYRDAAGTISHSGLVRSAPRGGPVLIESKWGRLGRYVHQPADIPLLYSEYTYYRSKRVGHVLRGLPERGSRPGPEVVEPPDDA